MPSTSTTDAFAELSAKIASAQAHVGVIGLGYVGLPLCDTLHRGGLPVLGFDIDPAKIEDLAAGRSYLKTFAGEAAQALAASDRFDATTDFARLAEMDVVLVCVPTPVGPHREPDLSYVVGAARECGRYLRPGQLLVLESTTFPGTTRDEFLGGVLEAFPGEDALVCGRDFFVAYSPEREDPGRKSHSTQTIPKLVGGLDPRATELAAALYRYGVDEVVQVTSAEVAESAKLLENIFRSVNIALVNELKTILDAMEIDVWEVVDAASTKPFGFMRFTPGPGLGGHCIPIDPFYLAWKAREVGHPTRFIELAGEINTAMPTYVMGRLALALNEVGQAVRGSRVLVLGLAYKPDVDDTRESPSFELIKQLRELGAEVDYHDPHIPESKPVRRHDLGLTSVPLDEQTLAGYDAVLIATDHTAVDYELVARSARLIVDTRNAIDRRGLECTGRLVKA